MFPSFYEEEAVKIDGENTLRLAINFRALTAIEGVCERGMDQIIPPLLTGSAPLNVEGKVLWGLMRQHHPESTLDDAAGLMFNKATAVPVGLAMSALLKRAFNIEEPKAKDKNPRVRRGASKTSSSHGSKPEPVA